MVQTRRQGHTHLERTRRLKAGDPLNRIAPEGLLQGMGHPFATVLPMSDQPVRTMVDTDEGELAFQEYFVHRRCEPKVKGFRFVGVEEAEPASGAKEAIESADAIVICPSNPWVSVDPILAVFSPLLSGEGLGVRSVAISPIIGGETVKGPAAKMYRELGIEPSALAVAKHYRGVTTHFVMDNVDSQLIESVRGLNMQVFVTNTLMKSHVDRKRLASEILDFIGVAV
ncbi:MAG: 2-phospho-L-lactate transferase CofD family protein [Anaerolineales bacterium]